MAKPALPEPHRMLMKKGFNDLMTLCPVFWHSRDHRCLGTDHTSNFRIRSLLWSWIHECILQRVHSQELSCICMQVTSIVAWFCLMLNWRRQFKFQVIYPRQIELSTFTNRAYQLFGMSSREGKGKVKVVRASLYPLHTWKSGCIFDSRLRCWSDNWISLQKPS